MLSGVTVEQIASPEVQPAASLFLLSRSSPVAHQHGRVQLLVCPFLRDSPDSQSNFQLQASHVRGNSPSYFDSQPCVEIGTTSLSVVTPTPICFFQDSPLAYLSGTAVVGSLCSSIVDVLLILTSKKDAPEVGQHIQLPAVKLNGIPSYSIRPQVREYPSISSYITIDVHLFFSIRGT